MTEKEIIVTINGFLVEEFEVEEEKIEPNANLKETLDLDSLDYVDLVVVIEDAFDPNTLITGVKPGNQYFFTWEILGGVCGESSDEVSTSS